MQTWADILSLDNVVTDSEKANEPVPKTVAASANTDDTTRPHVPTPNTLIPFNVDAIAPVRLPGFWRHSPQQWFTHAEAIFANQRVRADLSRVNHVLAALDEDGICTVSDLLGPDVQYSAVKSRLVTAYAVPQATLFRSIDQHGGMGDRRPSQLLRDMRSFLPDGIGDAALKEFWLQKLPPTILAIVSGLDGSLESLAERADRVADASAGRDIDAVSTSRDNDRFRSMETAISGLTTQIAALIASQVSLNRSSCGQNRSRSQTRSRSQPHTRNDAWCYYHNCFGSEARNCREPCTYTSEN